MHPAAPVPTPQPHSCMKDHQIKLGDATVKINDNDAARATDMVDQCASDLKGCPPGGPGVIVMGSATVMIGMMGAARKGDPVLWAGCVGPIPCPKGEIDGPCSDDVDIG